MGDEHEEVEEEEEEEEAEVPLNNYKESSGD